LKETNFSCLATPMGRRQGGRRRTRWRDYISDLARSRLGTKLGESSEIAENPHLFRDPEPLLPKQIENRVRNCLNCSCWCISA